MEESFHGAIVEGSRNEFLQRGWEIARLNLHRGLQDRVGIQDDETRQRNVHDHMAIAAAVEKGEGPKAEQLMKSSDTICRKRGNCS